MQRIPGPKEPAELTYYTLYNGKPLLGTTAAKILTTVDSQRMALTLGYVVQVQADRKNNFYVSLPFKKVLCNDYLSFGKSILYVWIIHIISDIFCGLVIFFFFVLLYIISNNIQIYS